MIYQIILINGKIIEFEADAYELEDGTYQFYRDGEIVGEFQKNNIAGFWSVNEEDEYED